MQESKQRKVLLLPVNADASGYWQWSMFFAPLRTLVVAHSLSFQYDFRNCGLHVGPYCQYDKLIAHHLLFLATLAPQLWASFGAVRKVACAEVAFYAIK
jgi:hypothetical protein